MSSKMHGKLFCSFLFQSAGFFQGSFEGKGPWSFESVRNFAKICKERSCLEQSDKHERTLVSELEKMYFLIVQPHGLKDHATPITDLPAGP